MQGLSFTHYNVPLVVAGTKDVTRRLVRFPKHIDPAKVHTLRHSEAKRWVALDAAGVYLGDVNAHYFPGQTVFLAEQFTVVGDDHGDIVYRSDYERDYKPNPTANKKSSPTWTPPWLLSAAMARHRLLIHTVRAERLQAIEGADVLREGVWRPPPPPPAPASGPLVKGECVDLEFLRNKFARAWDQINAHREGGASWADDPFVWRIELNRLIEDTRAHG